MALPDVFTRADNASLGADWVDRVNGFAINTNQAKANATANCVSVYTGSGAAATSDHYAQVTVVDYTTRYAGPMVRTTTSSTLNGYGWLTDPTGVLKVYRCDAGTFIIMASPGTAVANGDILKLSVTGTTLSYYKNGTLIGSTATNIGGNTTNYTGGAFGMYGNGAGVILDDFNGADVGGSSFFGSSSMAIRAGFGNL